MKKIFLLIFITFCSLIFYQIILGRNGLIEGYRIQKEKEQLIYYKSLLQKQNKELKKYIKELKNNPNALKSFAEQLGYFEDDVQFIKIIDELEKKNLTIPDYPEKNISINKLWEKIEENNNLDNKIKKIRIWLSVFFYLFFGFFIVLIIFGVKKKDE